MQATDKTGLRLLGKFWSSDIPDVRPWLSAHDVLNAMGSRWSVKSVVRRITSLQACNMLESSTRRLEHWEDRPHCRAVQWRVTDSGIEMLRENQPDVRFKWIEDEGTKI